jgi:hypothetical protein
MPTTTKERGPRERRERERSRARAQARARRLIVFSPAQVEIHTQRDELWEEYRKDAAQVHQKMLEKGRVREERVAEIAAKRAKSLREVRGDHPTSRDDRRGQPKELLGLTGSRVICLYLPLIAIQALEDRITELRKTVTRVSRSSVVEFLACHSPEIPPDEYARKVIAGSAHRRGRPRSTEGDQRFISESALESVKKAGEGKKTIRESINSLSSLLGLGVSDDDKGGLDV